MGNPDGSTPRVVVSKMAEAARNPRNHRYSASRGIPRLREEIKIYEKDFNPERVRGKHVAPHTIEIAVIQPAGSWLVEVQDEAGARRVPLTKEKLVVGTSTMADLVAHRAHHGQLRLPVP